MMAVPSPLKPDTPEEFYRSVLENAPWGAIVASTELDGRCQYINPEFTRITGYDLDDIPTVNDWVLRAYPDDDYRKHILAQWNEDTSSQQMGRDVVYRVRCKDGTTKSIQFRANLLPASWMIVMLLDVTRRDEAEQALQDSEERYRQLVETSPFGIVLHTGGEILFANNAAAAVVDAARPEELEGRNVLDFVHPDSRESAVQRISRILEHGQAAGLEEERFLRLDGKPVEVEVAGRMVQFRGSAVSQVVFHDITERKRLQREQKDFELRVQQAQRTQSLALLAGAVAHDLNNLLVGILGNAELALMPDREKRSSEGYLNAIVETAQRAADLSGQLLAFAGQRPLDHQRLDFDVVTKKTGALLESQVGRRAELSLQLHGSLPPLEGDEIQLRQVLVNLVANATEAMGTRGGRIEIRTSLLRPDDSDLEKLLAPEAPEDEAYLLLEVTDDGEGMDPTTAQRIFDPFFTTKSTGRGLGLASVQGIVKAHHGVIRVESKPGQGTSFKVLLPASSDGGSLDIAEELSQDDWDLGEGTVLLLDDEEIVRQTATELIQQTGLQVEVAQDGATAAALLAANPSRFIAVVLDLTMPGWSGERTLLEIRAIDRQLPVVISSGYDENGPSERLGELAPGSFLQKPYTLAKLVRALRRAIQ